MSLNNSNSKVEKEHKRYDAHAKYGKKIIFKNKNMDFFFQWLLGGQTHGSCELGEAVFTASRIKNGDPESWEKEWTDLAKRVETRADKALEKGHVISAREAFFRASVYYRLTLITTEPESKKWRVLSNKMHYCFRKGGELFDPVIETINIPFEGTTLPGYFQKADNSGKKHKTLIMIGGGETFAQDQYFYIAPAAIKRGYNFVTIDLPGQGDLPTKGLNFRPDTEVPMRIVLDYALSRLEVDPQQIAAYGISGGGYYVPRAAAHDERIKACITNSMISDLGKIWGDAFHYPKILLKIAFSLVKRFDRFRWQVVKNICWRWGVGPLDIATANKGFVFDCGSITCPLLIIIGEGEYTSSEEIRRQQHQCLDTVKSPEKKLMILPINEGAGHHCQGENLSLMSQVVFDWLDEIFAKKETKP